MRVPARGASCLRSRAVINQWDPGTKGAGCRGIISGHFPRFSGAQLDYPWDRNNGKEGRETSPSSFLQECSVGCSYPEMPGDPVSLGSAPYSKSPCRYFTDIRALKAPRRPAAKKSICVTASDPGFLRCIGPSSGFTHKMPMELVCHRTQLENLAHVQASLRPRGLDFPPANTSSENPSKV